jgi:hypothetical protein
VYELPTTHSVGRLAREVGRRRGLAAPLVHVYFHDSDLLDRRRRIVLSRALRILARRCKPLDLERAVEITADAAPSVEFATALRPSAG